MNNYRSTLNEVKNKDHLKKLISMLDKEKPGSADHSQIRHAISSMYGDKHIPSKHKNVTPDSYNEGFSEADWKKDSKAVKKSKDPKFISKMINKWGDRGGAWLNHPALKEDLDESELYEDVAKHLLSEGIELEDLSEEELEELVGAIARTAGKGVKKALFNKQGNFRMSTAGRADSAENKAKKVEKSRRDKERLQKARERIRKSKRP